MTWRSRSIAPAIITHAVYDTSALGLGAWQIHHGMAGGGMTALDWWALLIGAGLIGAAIVLWRGDQRGAGADRRE